MDTVATKNASSEIKQIIESSELKKYKLAQQLRINPGQLSVRLRGNLTEKQAKNMYQAEIALIDEKIKVLADDKKRALLAIENRSGEDIAEAE